MSTRRNLIVTSGEPRGRFQEAEVKVTAVKPGMNVKITGTTVTGGTNDDVFEDECEVHLLEVQPGMAGGFMIVTPRRIVGGGVDDTIAADTRTHCYIPLPGDDLFLLGLSGQTLNAGTRATFNAAGKLIASATGEWLLLDSYGTLSADTLVLARLLHSNTATAS